MSGVWLDPSSTSILHAQEFEFLSIEQETRPKKAISNKRVWNTSKEWNTAIFISGNQKCKVAPQDVISVILLGIYPASNTSIYTLSTYARHVIINPVLRIKILLFQINFATLPQYWSSIAWRATVHVWHPEMKIAVFHSLLVFQTRLLEIAFLGLVSCSMDRNSNSCASCVRTAKALARLRGCAGSPEPSLVAYVIST